MPPRDATPPDMAAPPITGVPAAFDHPNDRAQFRRPAHQPGVELYRIRWDAIDVG